MILCNWYQQSLSGQSDLLTLIDILTINRYFRPLHRPRRLTAFPNKQNLPSAISDFGNRPSVSIFHRRATPSTSSFKPSNASAFFCTPQKQKQKKKQKQNLPLAPHTLPYNLIRAHLQGSIAQPRAIQQITEPHLPVGFQGGDLQSSTMSSPGDNHSLFARHYIDYVYAPGLLLIVGTLIVKKEWAPWAALVAVAFGIYNFMAFRKLPPDETSPKSMSTNL